MDPMDKWWQNRQACTTEWDFKRLKCRRYDEIMRYGGYYMFNYHPDDDTPASRERMRFIQQSNMEKLGKALYYGVQRLPAAASAQAFVLTDPRNLAIAAGVLAL
ncbi:hypothetical protein [Paraherbaspirillum soli]|uniref:Uncharacterized protein n=1 Tax=Paraherbaspirillum soli TaxID=631222 RepID=A0ABW0M672_9BURK